MDNWTIRQKHHWYSLLSLENLGRLVQFDDAAMTLRLILVVTLIATIKAQAADNGILGTPRVTCEENRLLLDVETKQPFFGHVFVKGKYKDDQCAQRFNDTSRRGAYFMVPLGHCGMQRLRSASPRGMSFFITVIVSFHPLFITRTDRAFHVRCFYVEPDELVSAQLEVSMLPTTIVQDSMSMPTCTYTVRLDSPDGKVVNFANVGDRVFHVWDCKGPDMGILVKKCFVNNGENGGEVAVLDYNGCSSDSNLLSELTYDPSLMKAHAQSHVFKYADQSTLFFACQIRMCQKKLGMCEGVTPPKCSSSADPLKMHRRKREFDLENTVHISPRLRVRNGNSTSTRARHRGSNSRRVNDGTGNADEIDVMTEEIMVLDLDKTPAGLSTNDSLHPVDSNEAGLLTLTKLSSQSRPVSSNVERGVLCVSTQVVVLFVAMSFIMVILAASISAFVCRSAAAARTKLGQFLAPSNQSDTSDYSTRPPSKASLVGVASKNM